MLDKDRSLFAKWRGFLDFGFIFEWKSAWTESMAHGPWRRWSMVDWAMASRRSSSELGLAAAPGHDGSRVMAQQRERSTWSLSQASPGCGWRCGDRAMVVKKWRWRRSVWAMLGCGEKRREGGGGER
jgi:hypothetical protein